MKHWLTEKTRQVFIPHQKERKKDCRSTINADTQSSQDIKVGTLFKENPF
uniref:Uncharacterized protein n=1 Tax=Anguilla anguilla TaxID=7936 RepID=A0A0E9T232_ANGAN